MLSFHPIAVRLSAAFQTQTPAMINVAVRLTIMCIEFVHFVNVSCCSLLTGRPVWHVPADMPLLYLLSSSTDWADHVLRRCCRLSACCVCLHEGVLRKLFCSSCWRNHHHSSAPAHLHQTTAIQQVQGSPCLHTRTTISQSNILLALKQLAQEMKKAYHKP